LIDRDARAEAAPGSPRVDPDPDEILVISGMSGAGRSTAVKALEDLGWYVVDNLPPALIVSVLELTRGTADEPRGTAEEPVRLAVAVDVRSRRLFSALAEALADLTERGVGHRLLFLDASDEVLVRRFESVRRPHPLQGEGRLLDGIQRERVMLSQLRERADVRVDTTNLNVHQLAAKVVAVFGDDAAAALRVTVMSFGFKYGIPMDADMVADVRFLPNPFWKPDLRPLNGLDAPVRDYVLGQDGAEAFLDAYVAALRPVLRGYVRENKRYATVAIGCTGGKHRSVAMSEALAARIGSSQIQATSMHRDLGRE
jgi:UPF0042 nucleotide-binding protein